MKTLSLNQMENLQGGKFWGSETNCVNDGPLVDWDGVCGVTCYTDYYVFWIRMDSYESDSYAVPCDN